MKILKIIAGVLGFVALIGIGLYVTGYLQPLLMSGYLYINKPAGEFDPADAAPAPDYADPANWAALPDLDDPADLVPAGVGPATKQGTAPVDVFFIHPTGYLGNASWTSPMDPDSATEENTRWMMANQASAFNGCCNVYAPRYREASIFAYIGTSKEKREKVLDFAYQDVLRAFEYFLANYNQGKPFIIASHSQGTHHARRLLHERIDNADLHERLVAAYIIGSVLTPISPSWFAGMDHIVPCQSANDLGCVVHWDTVAEGGDPISREEDSLCTNPLTWTVDDDRASADLHDGAVPITGTYNVSVGNDDASTGQQFDRLAAPIGKHTWAQCRDGTLFVADQEGTAFSLPGGGKNYHGLDYPLFHMDIRNNANLRTTTFLQALTETQLE